MCVHRQLTAVWPDGGGRCFGQSRALNPVPARATPQLLTSVWCVSHGRICSSGLQVPPVSPGSGNSQRHGLCRLWGTTPAPGTKTAVGRAWAYLCDGQLLLGHVARHIDHLHAVSERLRDGVRDVGRADEQYLGEAARCWGTGRSPSPRAQAPDGPPTLDRSTGTSR